ncbi:hypothetical protein K2173_023247 [Erythroxylum novogranatense]|uniref:U-box domain-containing protein n=1 Tax=Erythroxylum novogranatense TaxID=1862640 RepID=A0AAV8T8D0_9ROSI|nr:hypothetical protein K2173_023247 [Erythroxylum novogranatense]
MYLSWRRRARNVLRSNNIEYKELYTGSISSGMEIVIPTHFRCPISLELMKDPVTLSTGITYDRESIEKWIDLGNQTCPVTNMVLRNFDQIPNHSLRRMIQDWCSENRSHGIERIPTPRVPVTPYEVSSTCKKIMEATQQRDENKCLQLVEKIKTLGNESERNKRCFRENGGACALSACFESFASEKHVELLKEILSVLTWMIPQGVEGQSKLGSMKCLSTIVWLLKSRADLSTRQNTVLAIKRLLALDQSYVLVLTKIEGFFQALISLIKEPISPSATKASLQIIFYTISEPEIGEKATKTFVELGLVSGLVEILVDSDKGICEKALCVLEQICNSSKGREGAFENDLILPLLVKKILRVSFLTSELSVSIIWKLCKNDEEHENNVAIAALESGGFQKLLVLLQVGCSDKTKDKVKDLLKLLNLYRVKFHFVDPCKDFKYLKGSS